VNDHGASPSPEHGRGPVGRHSLTRLPVAASFGLSASFPASFADLQAWDFAWPYDAEGNPLGGPMQACLGQDLEFLSHQPVPVFIE